MAPRKTGEEREAEIRRKLLIRAESTKKFIRAMSATARQEHQTAIDAYLLALRRWDDQESGSCIPCTPSFTVLGSGASHRKWAAVTQRSGSQA